MELENALEQIAEIHRQITLTRTFRGYRAATTLFTACVAFSAAVFQRWFLPNPRHNPLGFVELWVFVAIGCLIVVGTEMVHRFRGTNSSLQRQLTVQAVEQFLPCMVIGGLVTFVFVNFAHDSLWLLPGLWSIFFGLGIFSSRQLLPRPIIFIAAFYLLCGLIYLTAFQSVNAFSPWFMASSFGVGQTVIAFVLYWSLERQHES
jgi:hypothetical protein